MKILYIWDGDYPWDIRVEKVCATLINENHEVHLVCRNTRREPTYELYDKIHIHRLPCLPALLGNLNSALTFPAFFNPIWLWLIFKTIKSYKCDLIYIRDLPMALAGIFSAKIFNIPTILDMAECYPEMLRCTWKFEGFKLKNFFLRNPYLADLVEYISLKYVDHIFVMVEESENRLIKKNIDPNKIHILSNTPIIKRFSLQGKSTSNKSNILELLYVGLLNPSRGLDTVLLSLSNFIQINSNIRLTVIGKGKAEKRLKELSKNLELDDYVSFLGWIDNKEVPTYISNCDIGLVPHHKCSHWDSTIPNKLFDYMAANKPVIVSNAAPIKRIVENVNCGLVYEDYNIDSFIHALQMLEDVITRNELATNGLKAVKDKYNWTNEEVVLRHVLSLVQQ